jgi:hypothetical protein
MPEFQVRLLCTYEVHTTLTVTAESAAAAKAHVEQLLREGESPQLFTRESSGVITGVDSAHQWHYDYDSACVGRIEAVEHVTQGRA